METKIVDIQAIVGWTVLAVVVALTVGVLSYFACLNFVDKIRVRRGRKMIKLAAKKGVLFVVNSNAGVTAITSAREFDAELARAFKSDKPWERIVVKVAKTFPFWTCQESQAPIHCGSKDDLQTIGKELVERITGIKVADVRYCDFKEALGSICREDKRLFVPFSGACPDPTWQMSFFRQKDYSHAKGYLLSILNE